MKLLNTLPWFGARRWTNSWTITNSPNASGRSSRSVLRVNRPFVEIDAHFLRMSRRCTSRTVTPMRSAHCHTAPFKSPESFQTLSVFIFVANPTSCLSRQYSFPQSVVSRFCRARPLNHGLAVRSTDNREIGQTGYRPLAPVLK